MEIHKDITLTTLASFKFERVLNEDPITRSVTLLGSFCVGVFGRSNAGIAEAEAGREMAIIKIEKTAIGPESAVQVFEGLVRRIEVVESTDIYTWMFGWLGEEREKDVKINIVCPATEVHIRKYTTQEMVMVRETPEMYERIVKPYIMGFPAARTQWVENILAGTSEQSKVLYTDRSFLILPDMKWDLTTISSLYLVAIVRDRNIRSLRDLRRGHIILLKGIRKEAGRVVGEKWGLGRGALRMWVHYQPSYYHFHVHIVNANQGGVMGMAVGQAHLLDDVISLLELDAVEGPGVFERMTMTYGLGDQHGLYEAMRAEQQD